MENVGYYNGTLAPMEEIRVPMLDRACFYGDGVYDATIFSSGVILYEDDHVQRFFNSMKIMRFAPNFSYSELCETLQRIVDACSAETGFLYWQISRGTGPRQHEFLPGVQPNLWAYAVPLQMPDLSKQCQAITVPDTRFLHCNAKTLNLLPNVLAAQAAADAGCSESIFVRDGFVTECHCHNVHILQDGRLVTHPANNLILPGIARKHLIAMAKQLGIPVDERPFTVAEMMEAEEVFTSSSSTFALGVERIDGQPVGQRNRETLALLQRELTAEYHSYINERKR